MPEEMMNTKEVAHYLRIHEKHVYALIKWKRIPSTRITGKWVFPKRLIDEWIESDAQKGLVQAKRKKQGNRGDTACLAQHYSNNKKELWHDPQTSLLFAKESP